jgi:DNA-binding LacI/PurR family transcriptional regulator
MGITLKQLAAHCGLSIGTVSRALSNDPKIAEKTRKKVNDLANRLDYMPSNLGRSLQARKSFLIGYLLSSVKVSFLNEILQGISQTASNNEYGLLVATSDKSHESEMHQLKLFRQKAIDGLIVSEHSLETAASLQKLKASGLPIVVCDFQAFSQEVPTIIIDDVLAMQYITEHLLSLGHKKIVYGYALSEHSMIRYRAVAETCAKAGVNQPVICNSQEELFTLLQSAENRPTAFIGYSDLIAIEAIQLARQMGLCVPKDLAVTGFDDRQFASWPEFSITTISQPKTEMGIMAADYLFNQIKGIEQELPKPIKPELIIRHSTVL